jgi:hypothetical protein
MIMLVSSVPVKGDLVPGVLVDEKNKQNNTNKKNKQAKQQICNQIHFKLSSTCDHDHTLITLANMI